MALKLREVRQPLRPQHIVAELIRQPDDRGEDLLSALVVIQVLVGDAEDMHQFQRRPGGFELIGRREADPTYLGDRLPV
ncbi:hypothetical protein [Asanoa siamensis]|uniref:hypothetical protein n=1 Tax=Asanoa siamensis TaxID=926357 RepID=UPI0019436673|nr:hypothetical protein [Asanoa siamensis]